MSSDTATQTQTPTTSPRGNTRKGGNRSRGGSRRSPRNVPAGGKGPQAQSVTPMSSTTDSALTTEETAATASDEIQAKDEEPVCWICAEPVKYYCVSECNHRTCHVCALRLRALYKKMDCTFCKDPQQSVIFTVSPDTLFSSFTPDSIPHKDSRLSIFFESPEMMEETLLLLRYNCPDSDCDYIGKGWGDLKLHVRATHGKLMCDLCIRNKKVFAHEHALYAPNQLPVHLPSIPHRPQKSVPKEQVEGGIHPLCEFCRECFFGEDELFAHMREKHEECFICKRNDVRDQYFQNYDSLEKHFNHAHHPCTQPQCLVRKFVVFNAALDLKAHMVEEHGADMSSRDKKDARRVNAGFEFEEVAGGGRRGRRDQGDRQREREPPPHQQQQPAPTPGPVRPTGNGRRREGFGANLTGEGTANPTLNSNVSALSRRLTPSPPLVDLDPAIAERHSAFIARLQSLSPNPSTAVPAVKAAIRGYRASETSARDLISTVWNVLDRNLEHTASVVSAFVDLLEEEEKKQDLLRSWKGFEVEQRRQFPDLVPAAIGTGYAAITTGRVLDAKHATASRSSQQSSRQVWDRVAQAAGSSSSPTMHVPVPKPPDRFPRLQPPAMAIPGPVPVPAFRQGARNTPWSSSSASGVRAPSSVPAPISARPDSRNRSSPSSTSGLDSGAGTRQAPPKLSNALFPELPTSSSARQKAPVSGNVSLRNILGNPTPPAAPAWQAGTNGTSVVQAVSASAADGSGEACIAGPGAGKGKKGKGKQKQTLFTLGSFPA